MRALFTKWFTPKINSVKKSVYYFSPFFEENAGYHWRVESWKKILIENGYDVQVGTATSEEEFYRLFPKENIKFQKAFLKRRFKQVLESRSCEVVIVRREMLLFNDYGNLFIQKLLLHFHPNAILDFDDDIAASKGQPKEITNLYGKLMLENGDKFNDSLKMFRFFIPATKYLKNKILSKYSSIMEDAICIIPTCVDYDKHPAKTYSNEKKMVTLGWIGSTGNYFLLDEILPEIEKVSKEFEIELLVVGGEPFERNTTFPIRFKQWSLANEIENLNEIDLGLMPLVNNEISKGKAGFKLIQYMALGIVSVASSITVNEEIIPSDQHGYLVDKNWFDTLKTAIENKSHWNEIGAKARTHVLEKYTFSANKQAYLNFIQNIQNKTEV